MIPSQPSTSKAILCPFCLRALSDASCSECPCKVPEAYLQASTELRPFPLPAFGWPRHGRSTYLAALTYHLTRLSLIWPSYSYREATDATRNFLTEVNEHTLSGSLPLKTDKGGGHLLLLLEDMTRWGTLGLAFEDRPSKDFRRFEFVQEPAEILRWSPFAMMVISPADLYDHGNWGTVDMLFNSYLEALDDNPLANPRGLAVVLTKGDLLQSQLPSEVLEYLCSDDLSSLLRPRRSNFAKELAKPPEVYDDLEVRNYLSNMRDHEGILSSWLSKDPHFRSLQVKARRHQIELRFSIVSALGEPARGDNTLPVPWNPKRVLDPLFWLLELEREHGGVADRPNRRESETPESGFHLIVHNRAIGGGEQCKSLQAQIKRSSGTLARIDEGLAHVSYKLRVDGVFFELPKPMSFAVRRRGSWGAGLGNSELLHAGDGCRIDDWEIEVGAGEARPRIPEES